MVNLLEIDWDILTNQDFEELCYEILDKEGFYNLKWLGRGGGDRGRDIICKKDQFLFDNIRIKKEFTYLVQCKKYVKRPPSPSDLEGTIAWANVHKPDFLVIMVSNILSSDTNDWVEKRDEDTKYNIIIIDEKDFERFFEVYEDVYTDFFESERSYYYRKIEDIKINIINLLLDKVMRNTSTISEILGMDYENVSVAIKELLDEEIISNNEDEDIQHSLKVDIDAFIKISKYLLSSDFKFTYLLSQYAIDLINMDLVNYVNERFYLDLNAKEKNQLHVLLAISPSSLYDALFYNPQLYKTSYDHMKEIDLPQEIAEKWKKSIINNFFMNLIQKTYIDLQNPESSNILKEKGIRGMKIDIGLNMASKEHLIFGMDSESVIMLHKAAGPIKAGQLISATDPDLFIEQGTILMNLGMPELAINNFNKAIEQVKEKEKLKVAWNNKGVSLMRLKEWDDAIICFDKALELDPDLEEAKKNKKACIENKEE